MLLRRRQLLWPWAATNEVVPGLVVKPRSEWTDTLPEEEPEPEDVRFLLVHHTAGSIQHREEDVPAILRGIHGFHVANRGWNDIAYNFLIDRHGGVWEGRAGSLDGPVQGDATGGNQGFSQLVCLIGDFTAELPTPEAQHSLVLTLGWLADRYSLDLSPSSVVHFTSRGSNRWPEGTDVATTPIAGHRDMSHTACPGDAFYPLLAAEITPQVRDVVSGSPAPEATDPPETTPTTSPATTSTTTSATTSTTTSTTAPPTASSTTPGPTTSLAAADVATDSSSFVWPVVTLVGGLAAGVIGWRMRRMGHRR